MLWWHTSGMQDLLGLNFPTNIGSLWDQTKPK